MNVVRKLGIALLALVSLWVATTANAQERPAVLVTDPSARKYRAAVQRFAEVGSQADLGAAAEFRNQIAAALEFSGLFTSLPLKAFLAGDVTQKFAGSRLVCSDWSQIGADAFVEGEVRREASGLSAEFRAWDVGRCRDFPQRLYRGSSGDQARIAKRIADDIVEFFTGKPGVSSTEIAFISTRSGNKEVYVVNVDGTRLRAATRNRSINTFPSWSPDSTHIVYTSYREGRRPGLYLLSRGQGSPGRILRNLLKGAPQYRVVFAPDGDHLALVMSVDGASEIFSVELDGGSLRRLTRDATIDVSPSWSPDGKHIAFVSDRTGSPQVYVMDADGNGVRRLTYNGSYNTDPAWSPDGRWIAYQARVGGQFDIWFIDPEGTVNVPFISHARSDENPTWAPDGRKLAFSSNRRGRYDIYTVDFDGGNLRRLTSDAGDNTTPAWGPYAR